MIKRRKVLSALGAASLVAAPYVRAFGGTPVKASLRLKWLPQAQFMGFYIAAEKGYYRAEGIDLTINPGGPNLLAENLVATGADTFGVSGGTDSVFAARDKKLPIVCFGIDHQITPFIFVSKKDGPVKTIQDFKGRVVTTWFTGANYVLEGVLAKAGVNPKDVNIQPQQVSATPFVEGNVDVFTATLYNEFYTLEKRIGLANLTRFAAEDYGITVPRDTLIVSETTAKEKPELLPAFLRASIRGWRDAFADQKAAIDLMMKIAPTLDRGHQEFMLAEIKRLMLAGKAGDEGLFWIDPVAVKTAHDMFLNYKVISAPVDLKAAFISAPLESIALADRKV
ncbi:NitT/TauT family transport system substrate-binding protein [Enhydrobacter aerosaccus]|uniref:Thiamine pyrimidine synthase n=1 Tax=Enhydrobacter aerosaccus TaxID=225324 RepID=A0A1T4JQR5_9HYPH|nr:ABC transporter substrate-binding protein [Enhydrobacter aerosaccus]SJZ32435.1 NitT/TauT family transport system substrate-binding protein [Enhydrobacter aerosaccus]